MADFMSSPYALLTVALVVLAVAVLMLMVWLLSIDRKMRGVADGLEVERRKVAEMQMAMGKRGAQRPKQQPPAQTASGMPVRAPEQQAVGTQRAAGHASRQASGGQRVSGGERPQRDVRAQDSGLSPAAQQRVAAQAQAQAQAQAVQNVPAQGRTRVSRPRTGEQVSASEAAAVVERAARPARSGAVAQPAASAQAGTRNHAASPVQRPMQTRIERQPQADVRPASRAATQSAYVQVSDSGRTSAPARPAGAATQPTRGRHVRQ